MSRLEDLAISDSGFVFDPYSGATFSVNATGLAVLRALGEGLEGEDVLERLRDRFEVRGDDLRRDLLEFLGLLRRHDLVPRDFDLELP